MKKLVLAFFILLLYVPSAHAVNSRGWLPGTSGGAGGLAGDWTGTHNMDGNPLTDSTGPMQHGGTCTPDNVAIGANDFLACFDAEIKADLYLGNYLYIEDNNRVYLGDDLDYWFYYSSLGSFVIYSADVDGIGSAGILLQVNDGTNDIILNGNLSSSGGTITMAVGEFSSYVRDPGGPLCFGSTCSTTHGLTVGDSVFNGKWETNGDGYIDSQVWLEQNTPLWIGEPEYGFIGHNVLQPRFGPYSVRTWDWIFMDSVDRTTSLSLTATDSPRLVFASANINADTSAWGSIQTSSTGGEFKFYLKDGDEFQFSSALVGAGNQATSIIHTAEILTFAPNPGEASKTTTVTAIPDGAVLLGVSTRVLGTGTNCAGMSIGDGADVDLWGADQSVTAGGTTDNSDATAQWNNPQLNSSEITITGTDGAGTPTNCFNLSVRVVSHYMLLTAPTN